MVICVCMGIWEAILALIGIGVLGVTKRNFKKTSCKKHYLD